MDSKLVEEKHKKNQFKIANVLGHLGLIPFVVIVVLMPCSQFGLIDVEPQHLLRLFAIMSGLLLSFLAGTIWSEALVGKIERTASKHLLYSSGFAMAAFIGFYLQNRWSIMIFGLSFLVLFFTEESLRNTKFDSTDDTTKDGEIVSDYLYMRRHLTYKVVIIHLVALLLYIINPAA